MNSDFILKYRLHTCLWSRQNNYKIPSI